MDQQQQPPQETPTPESIEAVRAYETARQAREAIDARCLLGFLVERKGRIE